MFLGSLAIFTIVQLKVAWLKCRAIGGVVKSGLGVTIRVKALTITRARYSGVSRSLVAGFAKKLFQR